MALLAVGFASPAGAVPLAVDDCSGDDCEPGCLLCLCCPRSQSPLLDAIASPPVELPSLGVAGELTLRPPDVPARDILHVPRTPAAPPY